MAVLTTEQRADCRTRFIREFFVGLAKVADLTTDEVQTLVNDLDAWLESQMTEANQSITLSVRTKASADTKFAALAFVALKRAGVF